MSDLVEVIWAGPFEADFGYPPRRVTHGERLEVTAQQARENPGWFQPIPAETPKPTSTPPVIQAETV